MGQTTFAESCSRAWLSPTRGFKRDVQPWPDRSCLSSHLSMCRDGHPGVETGESEMLPASVFAKAVFIFTCMMAMSIFTLGCVALINICQENHASTLTIYTYHSLRHCHKPDTLGYSVPVVNADSSKYLCTDWASWIKSTSHYVQDNLECIPQCGQTLASRIYGSSPES